MHIRPPARLLAALGLAACAWPLAAAAQDVPVQPPPPAPAASAEETTDAYEGRMVREVRLVTPALSPAGEPAGAAELDPGLAQYARNQIRTVAGRPYRRQTILSDVARLNRTGRFGEVESFVQLADDGSVIVTFHLVEQPVIRSVEVVGNRRLGADRIAEVVDILQDTPVDRFQIDRAARRIEDLYRRKGYYLAQVTINEEALAEQGALIFQVREGERIKVTGIRFEGNASFTPAELRSAIKTRTAHLLEKGPLDDDVLEQDVAGLIQFYKDRGYLDVRAGYQVRPSPNGREAIVIFHVDEGPLYTLRSVDVQFPDDRPVGRYTAQQLAGLMTMKPGDVYSVRELDRSIDAIRAAYGELGYTDVRIQPREVRDLNRPQVDLLIGITEGNAYLTGAVPIIGNEITKQGVIRRQLQITPERPLNPEDVEESERRLENLRLFEPGSVRLTLQTPDPSQPDHRDVLVEVEETNTGTLSFGVAYNTDAGPIGSISFEQRNFDITDWPDSWSELVSGRALRGAGQTLLIQAQPGTETQNYALSLSEPSLFETSYGGSASVYYRTRELRDYDERRVGGRLSIGRVFGSRWRSNLFARVENIELSNIDESAPVDVFDVEDPHTLAALGLQLSRSTLDDPYRPSRGNRVEFTLQQAGLLGGDFTYTQFDAQHTVYFTLHESFLGYKTVLSLSTRLGYIPQDEDEVPVYERFYLGGRSFRGFAYRGVSPIGIRNDTGEEGDDPVGGTWLFFFGPEITVPVWQDNVALAFFADTGTVTNDPGFEDYRVAVGAGLRIYIPQLSPIPLAFDFGFPILKQDGDDTRIFTFSVDLPF